MSMGTSWLSIISADIPVYIRHPLDISQVAVQQQCEQSACATEGNMVAEGSEAAVGITLQDEFAVIRSFCHASILVHTCTTDCG